jgi:hypothetical protein
MPVHASRSLRFLMGLGWVTFGTGIVIFALLFLRFGGSSAPKAKWRRSWGQPRWVTTRDPQGKFLIDYPTDWDLSTPFERFTRHRVGSLVAMDTLALRRGDPIGLLVVLRYVAPAAKSRAEWLKETGPDGALKGAFGAKLLLRKQGQLAGVDGLHFIAEDRVADSIYHLESWFLPAGDTAYRVTAAAPREQFAAVEPMLRRMISSLRFVDGKAPGQSAARSDRWNAPTSPAAAHGSRLSATHGLSAWAIRSTSPGPPPSMKRAASWVPATRTRRPVRS